MAPEGRLKSVTLERHMSDKRTPEVRLGDHREIFANYGDASAAEQASRCTQCGVPYCQAH